jgi:hypothetical protein
MSTTPPTADDDKPEEPKSLFEKIGAAIPIAIAALATAFAGMSSSSLQRAMFFRTQAGQDQSKSTNQWTFAGLKRNRSLTMEAAGSELSAQSGFRKVTFPEPSSAARPEEKEALEWLALVAAGKDLPRVNLAKSDNEDLEALLKAIRDREPEEEILKKAAKVKLEDINKVIDDAEKEFEVIDSQRDKVIKAAARIVAQRAKEEPKEATAVRAVRFGLEQRRYRAESYMTQRIGFLYDARVRVVTAISEKYRKRSERFFYAMLIAQVGAVVSGLALSRKSMPLWLLAILVGLAAGSFGGYVYVF